MPEPLAAKELAGLACIAVVAWAAGCASTRPIASPAPPGADGPGFATIKVERSLSPVAGAGSVFAFVWAPGREAAAPHTVCELRAIADLDAEDGGPLLLDREGFRSGRRVILDAAAYRKTDQLPVLLSPELAGEVAAVAEAARAGAGEAVRAQLLENIPLLPEQRPSVKAKISRADFEQIACECVGFGTALGHLGPGGSLSVRVAPGRYLFYTQACARVPLQSAYFVQLRVTAGATYVVDVSYMSPPKLRGIEGGNR